MHIIVIHLITKMYPLYTLSYLCISQLINVYIANFFAIITDAKKKQCIYACAYVKELLV